MRRGLLPGAVLLAAAIGCHSGGPPPPPADECAGFVVPERTAPPGDNAAACDHVDPTQPDALTGCQRGSGHPGRWDVDADGLPCYWFAVEERCDPAARAWSPRPYPLRDPIHLVGNGRGLVAMAHASGGIEVYSQDRGHKWLNHVDTWADPDEPDYPPHLGGGFSYLALGDQVRSTRFEDLPVATAAAQQARRFGVGYYETETTWDDLRVTRRVLAPDADARALVAEVTLENPGAAPLAVGLVEYWEVNLHEIQVELVTSDLAMQGITAQIDRSRRHLMDGFTHHVSWDATARVALAETTAKALPDGVASRADVAKVDYFPDPIYLAVLDDAEPDAVWLGAAELFAGADRAPPASAAAAADAGSRALDVDGVGQPVVLAVRVPVTVPAGGSVTRRFAYGYVPGGGAPDDAVAELRARAATLRADTQAAWRSRLVWAAIDLPDGGTLQRELAWAAYSMLANTTFDEYRGVRLMGQGGAYKYIHGLDGAIGDLALFADALTLVDPSVARDTLVYAMASQHGATDATPSRYPYATTGVGAFSDVGIYSQRSDAYYLVPSSVARYVALTRDPAFLGREVPYWPLADGDAGDVVDHVRRSVAYGTETLGIGARGLVAMGTGDYADGIASLADQPATPRGTSSTYNAGFVVVGFPLAAEVFGAADPELGTRLGDLAASQAQALLTEAWEGRWFYRGFVDSGDPLAPGIFFLEPQLFPVLAGIVDDGRRDVAFASVVALLETPQGAVSNVVVDASAGAGGPDRPQVGGIWPVANAWLTEAYARRSPDEGWSSLTRNTLAAHAQAYPDLWYGIWTGPDSFNGPTADRPGEADAHLATALTDYPALNAHVHTSPLRALQGLVGVSGTADGLRIEPRLPTETFTVRWPRLEVRSTPDSIGGSLVVVGDGPVVMRVLLPSALRGAAVRVRVDDADVPAVLEGDLVRFTVDARAEVRASFAVGGS